ncbi:MAG: hypothetical protein Q4Q06_01270 [Bacteroidota bacterium]|nr:hypothetical protein [Bacteroidota bacterium]
MRKKKEREISYEEYIKYKGRNIYTKARWENATQEERMKEYKRLKGEYNSWVVFKIFCIVILVGVMAGGIFYGIWIDDILVGISIALGFPLFLIASCMGAGKGL